MTVHLTIDIPDELYQRLEERAVFARRSIHDEALEVLSGAVPTSGGWAEDLTRELLALEQLGDQELRQIVQTRLPENIATELQELHLRRQREGLSATEQQRCEQLVLQDESNMLRRAKAAAILKATGVDVDSLVRK